MIVGIAGYAKSGKDTVADRLVEKHGFTKVCFAHALKEEVLERLPRTLLYVHDRNCTETHLSIVQERVCTRRMVYDTKPPGIRELLQEYGTEVRRRDDPDYWVERWSELVYDRHQDQDVVTADVRFKNEAQAIIHSHGALWRVNRSGIKALSDHESEHALVGCESWFVENIFNSGSIDELHDMVDLAVAEMKRAEAA